MMMMMMMMVVVEMILSKRQKILLNPNSFDDKMIAKLMSQRCQPCSHALYGLISYLHSLPCSSGRSPCGRADQSEKFKIDHLLRLGLIERCMTRLSQKIRLKS